MNRNSIWRKMPRCLWKPCTAETLLRLNQDSILQHSHYFMAPQTRVIEHQAKKKKGKEAFGLKGNKWPVGTWATGTIF